MGLSDSFGQAGEGFIDGIFCDCSGTLFGSNSYKDEELVAFLNAQHAAGKNVVLFSVDPQGVAEPVSRLGLHPDLTARIHEKLEYMDALLGMVIDDDPPFYLNANAFYHPHDPALRQLLRAAPAADPGIRPPSV